MNPNAPHRASYPPFTLAILACSVLGLLVLGRVFAQQQPPGERTYYIVREGDTLWDITERFYQDPYLWPALWGQNPHILNPHWIYPGDPVYLGSLPGGYLAEGPSPAGGPSPTEAAVPEAGLLPGAAVLHVPRRMADTALLSREQVRGAGRVLAAREDRLLLVQGDEVCLRLGEGPDDGSRTGYQILRPLRQVRDPQSGEKVGTLYGILGYVEVEGGSNQAPVVWTRILASWDPIQVGDLLRKGSPLPKEVRSKPASRDLRGRILAGLRSDRLIAQHDVCFIDKGIQEGVEVGDTFWVLDPARKVDDPLGRGSVALPQTRAAVLVVVHAEQETSTALVADSWGVFEAGYPVRARTEEGSPL